MTHYFRLAVLLLVVEAVADDDGVAVEVVEDENEVIRISVVLGLNNLSSFGNYYQSAYYNVQLSSLVLQYC